MYYRGATQWHNELKIHEHTHSYRQLWESCFHCDTSSFLQAGCHRTMYGYTPCLCDSVTCGPLSLGVPLLPRLGPCYTTPALTPIHLHRPFLSGQPVLAVTHRCMPPLLNFYSLSFTLPKPYICQKRTSFLLKHLHTSKTTCCGKPHWLNPDGQHKKHRVECQGLGFGIQGQEIRLVQKAINIQQKVQA